MLWFSVAPNLYSDSRIPGIRRSDVFSVVLVVQRFSGKNFSGKFVNLSGKHMRRGPFLVNSYFRILNSCVTEYLMEISCNVNAYA